MTNEQDRYLNDLSAREYTAIQLKLPNSGTEWIDKMIKEANKREFEEKLKVEGFKLWLGDIEGYSTEDLETDIDIFINSL